MRGYVRLVTPDHGWVDPVKKGWPGPMSSWTPTMWGVFHRAQEDASLSGLHEARAWAEGYRAVTLMQEGRR